MEVLASLSLTKTEYAEHMEVNGTHTPEFYAKYVTEVQQRIAQNARLEFERIWEENALHGTMRSVLTDEISNKINYHNERIQASRIWHNIELRRAVLDQALPRSLINMLGLDTLMARIPQNYLKAIFSAFLASRYVYKTGLKDGDNPIAFLEFVRAYIKQ